MCTPAHRVYMPQRVCIVLETTCGSKDLIHVIRLGSKYLSHWMSNQPHITVLDLETLIEWRWATSTHLLNTHYKKSYLNRPSCFHVNCSAAHSWVSRVHHLGNMLTFICVLCKFFLFYWLLFHWTTSVLLFCEWFYLIICIWWTIPRFL